MKEDIKSFKVWFRQLKKLIDETKIVFPKNAVIKFYHHYGMDNPLKSAWVTVIDHDYCKSLVFLLPGQGFPLHYHRIKEETYFILYGDLTIEVEEELYHASISDLFHVQRRHQHRFFSEHGAVLEEISTAKLNNDTLYADDTLRTLPSGKKSTDFSLEFILDILNEDGVYENHTA